MLKRAPWNMIISSLLNQSRIKGLRSRCTIGANWFSFWGWIQSLKVNMELMKVVGLRDPEKCLFLSTDQVWHRPQKLSTTLPKEHKCELEGPLLWLEQKLVKPRWNWDVQIHVVHPIASPRNYAGVHYIFCICNPKKKKKLLIFYEPTTTKRDLVQLSLLLTHVSVIFSFKYILLILHSAHSYELRHNLDTSKP